MSYPHKRRRVSPDPADYPFIFFGTPLPPLDPEVRDDGTYVPLWKQEVLHFGLLSDERFAMSVAEKDYTAPLQEASLLVISIQ
jgi:hypothetical protein